MTTVQNLVDRVYSRLQTKTERNVLSTSPDASTPTLSFTYPLGRIQKGAKVSVGLEDCGVWAVSMQDATVQRGDYGTIAAEHTSGDIALVDPPYTPFEIVTTINTGLRSLAGMGLPKYTTVELTGNASRVGYDLTGVTSFIKGHRVQTRDYGPEENWRSLHRSMWKIEQAQETDVFPSGIALFVYDYVPPGRQLRVTYQAPYTAISTLAQDVETITGLPVEHHDLLVVDACYRLLGGRLADRTRLDAQPNARRSDEVGTTDQIRATQPFFLERQEMFNAARAWQIREFGL